MTLLAKKFWDSNASTAEVNRFVPYRRVRSSQFLECLDPHARGAFRLLGEWEGLTLSLVQVFWVLVGFERATVRIHNDHAGEFGAVCTVRGPDSGFGDSGEERKTVIGDGDGAP